MSDADRGFVERNAHSRNRLLAIIEGLSAEELLRPIDGAWTTSALLAHMGFWDRFVVERWRLAARSGGGTPIAIEDAALDLVNDANMPDWLALSPDAVGPSCLDAAETVDRYVADLDDDVVAAVVAEGRPRMLDRSLHRSDHLATIDAAFPPG